MKRIAVGVLAAGALVIGGASLTNADLPKRAGESAKPETTDGEEKTFAFEMRDRPWKEVFQWFIDITEKEVSAPVWPRGSFTFIPPRGKRYTLTEITDIVNEALFAQEFLLERGQRDWVVTTVDREIFMKCRPARVEPEELAKLGKYEFVRVEMQLTALKAKDVQELDTLMGPFGKLVVLETPNKAILIDFAKNLRDVVPTLRDMENRRAEQLRLADRIIRQVEEFIDAVKKYESNK